MTKLKDVWDVEFFSHKRVCCLQFEITYKTTIYPDNGIIFLSLNLRNCNYLLSLLSESLVPYCLSDGQGKKSSH